MVVGHISKAFKSVFGGGKNENSTHTSTATIIADELKYGAHK